MFKLKNNIKNYPLILTVEDLVYLYSEINLIPGIGYESLDGYFVHVYPFGGLHNDYRCRKECNPIVLRTSFDSVEYFLIVFMFFPI